MSNLPVEHTPGSQCGTAHLQLNTVTLQTLQSSHYSPTDADPETIEHYFQALIMYKPPLFIYK